MFFQISLFLILFLTFDWEKLKYGSWHFLLWSKGCYSWLADNKRREITIIIAPALSAYWRDSISHLVHSPSTAHRPHSSKEMVKIRPEVLEWEMFNFMGFYNWISERVWERERERERERHRERVTLNAWLKLNCSQSNETISFRNFILLTGENYYLKTQPSLPWAWFVFLPGVTK